MGLAEGVALERQDHLPDQLQVRPRHAPRGAAAEEALAEVRQAQGAVLLGQDLAQLVGLPRGEAGRVDHHPRDVLLVDHDAAGLREGLLQLRGEGPVGGAVQPLHELPDPAVGRRADDGAGDHQALVVPGAHLLQQLPGGRGLDVEDAQGPTGGDQLPGSRRPPAPPSPPRSGPPPACRSPAPGCRAARPGSGCPAGRSSPAPPPPRRPSPRR